MLDGSHSILVQGIAAAKAGDAKEARYFLEWALRGDLPLHDRLDALYWLSEVSAEPAEQRDYLEEILANDLGDARARRKLAILNGKINPDEIIDPDKLQRSKPSGGPQATDAQRFTCPNCGGRMVYTPDGQSLICEYCAGRERLAQALPTGKPVEEDDFIVALATARGHLSPVAVQLLTCQGCGASFILPPEQLSISCPYCASSHVVQAETREVMRPDGLIPFKVSEKDARTALKAWFEEQAFEILPRVAIGRGLYLPAWTFTMGGQVTWSCLVQQQEEWKPQSGQQVVHQENLLVLATDRLPKVLIPALYRFDLGELTPYDQRYLANWLAETYQIPLADASLTARKMALDSEREKISLNLPQAIRDLNVRSANMIVESYRLILLPVWLTHYKLDESRYELLVNGQTGEVYGERPKKGLRKWLSKFF